MGAERRDLEEYRDFAVRTVFEAGRLSLGYFQTGIRPEFKDDDTPVTVADREGEGSIRARIEARYPDHAIVGEEFAEKEPQGSSCRWYVDPIDGTKAFVRGVPLYAVLLALEIDGEVEVGAAYFPALDELISAATGLGCYWNGRRAKVSDANTLSEAVVCFTEAQSFDEYGRSREWERIRNAAYSSRGWSDAYGHLLVATGRAEAMVEPAINPWDCAPFLPIIREAGGYFGDWSGDETIHAPEAISANPAIARELLDLVKGG